MTGLVIVLFMAVGFTGCGIWAHCLKAQDARRQEAIEYADNMRRAAAAEERRVVAIEKARREAEKKQRREAERLEREAAADARRAERQREQAAARAAAQAAKIAAARELAELRERELAAARELAGLQAAAPAERREAISNAVSDIADPVQAAPQAMTLEAFAAAHAKPEPKPVQDAPKPFKGQTVAFTGKLSGMTRQQAIEKVIQAGGKAYKTMPAGTTLLVVGANPGMTKMDKADEWIGQVRKITEAQFLAMFAA